MFVKILAVKTNQWFASRKLTILSFSLFFLLMSGYFILRPVRDEMGIQAGVENLQWLFTGTFLAMLVVVPCFGWLTNRIKRSVLIPGIYVGSSLLILFFLIAFNWLDQRIVSISFFIWLSVFNLFIISIFWSFNSDIFSSDQAIKLYGPIAAGGSTGAIVGPLIASTFGGLLGVMTLMFISAGFLLLAGVLVAVLQRIRTGERERKLHQVMTGSIWSGLRSALASTFLRQISLYILLYTTISTFLYFQQAHIISEAFPESANRTAYFGMRDLLVNSITLALQFFITARVMQKWGLVFSLMLVPAIASVGFIGLSISQSVVVLLVVQVLYRSLNFSVQRPAREVLFTRVSLEQRYKSKNFIDTAVYRGGDAISGWLFAAIETIASGLWVVSLVAVPVAVVWGLIGRKTAQLFNDRMFKFYKRYESTELTKKSA